MGENYYSRLNSRPTLLTGLIYYVDYHRIITIGLRIILLSKYLVTLIILLIIRIIRCQTGPN